MPTVAGRPSTMSSVNTGGNTTELHGLDSKDKQTSELQFDKLPTLSTFICGLED